MSQERLNECIAKFKKEKKRAKNSKKKYIPVWIKEETILYEEELAMLQVELLKFQNHVKEQGLKILMIFEGRDAAGKGGTIKRITEHLNPRGARVVALEKPNDKEISQWYFQRYAKHLPSAGEIVLFDRSWYNRAMVEPVMGFCTERQHHKFLKDAPAFEKMIVDEGITIFKFYLSMTTTFSPRFRACLIILAVPLEFLNLKATKPSAYLAICLLRIGPAALPYLSHSAGNFLIGSF